MIKASDFIRARGLARMVKIPKISGPKEPSRYENSVLIEHEYILMIPSIGDIKNSIKNF